jgi:ketosteroid isomerase-like protein
MGDIALAVRRALDAGDLSSFGDLLAPDVQWGAPGDPKPPCRNRRDVLRWYERGRAQGRRARVVEVAVHGEALVVHLRVRDETDGGREHEPQDRWQVLTCRRGQVADIRGFETQDEAVAYTAPR